MLVLATMRADVNGVVRRHLDARKCSFAPMDDAVRLTGMEYGGITPLGCPATGRSWSTTPCWPPATWSSAAGCAARSSSFLPADLLALPGAQALALAT